MHKRNYPVSVIIPAYNESATIKSVLERIDKKYETIVVDDGSTDETARIARKYATKVVTYRKNRGKGYAIRRGIAESHGKIIVFLDGDGQHDPDDIPKLTAPICKGKADFVIGARTPANGWRNTPFRFLTNRLSSMAVRLICSKGYYDVLSGFRAINKELVPKLILTKDGFETELESLIKSVRAPLRICQVPITHWNASRGSNLGVRAGAAILTYLCRELLLKKIRGAKQTTLYAGFHKQSSCE